MGAPLTREAILFRQRLLACSGLYHGDLDGLWGPQTDAAERAASRLYFECLRDLGAADPRSEEVLRSLQVPAQRPVRLLLAALLGQGWTVRLISGTRTYPEQAALYAQGRTTKGKIVTNAKAGESNHNWGIAVDVGVFDEAGRYLRGDNEAETKVYRELGAIGSKLDGIEWGGSWKKPDLPHYQLRTGFATKEARRRFEAGEPLIQP